MPAISREFSLKQKNNLWGAILKSIEIFLSFGGGLEGSNEKKMGREIVKILCDSSCVTVLWKLSLSKGGSLLRDEVC